MSGLYLHIPYCKQACNYCDFHFRVSFQDKLAMLKSMKQEMQLRKDYLEGLPVDTLYFGGGTPSVLSLVELEELIRAANELFPLSDGAEVTLEANPDDLNKSYLEGLKILGINRLSIGIQSFDDQTLSWMNRRHSAQQALASVRDAREAGFLNINIDLIYGIPGMSLALWEQTLEQALSLGVQHISAYHLSIESRTVFGVHQRRGQHFSVPEEDSFLQFQLLRSKALQGGWDHYEISNFSLPGLHSRHNTAYWQQKKYLGIGPSAHSFNGDFRNWNLSNNTLYIKKIGEGEGWFEGEELTLGERHNDYILTSLRTRWGVDGTYVKNNFGSDYSLRLGIACEPYLQEGYIKRLPEEQYFLTEKGMFVADRIASDLFFVD